MRWLVLFLPFFAFSHVLIFVHLGKEVPSYLGITIEQARMFNPGADIYLLTDQTCLLEGVRVVSIDSIPVTEEHKAFCRMNKIDPSISDGFWFYATERFFVLYDFLKSRGLEEVVHLENDTMLYIDLDELKPFFHDVGIAAPFQSLVGCIPCFIYIKDSQHLSFLIEHILNEMQGYRGAIAHLYINDMQTLASFYRKFGDGFMLPLPTLMPEYAKKFPPRRSHFVQDNGTYLRFLSKHADLFPGYIFDAAGLAIYLNGNDRRHSPGHGPGTIHSRCLFDPSRFSYFWGKDVKGRAIPYLSFEGKEYRIVNLHFHSKMPEAYASSRGKNGTLAELPLR
jgi:hypothetical protein